MHHTLPNLPYDYNALEPSIDAETMEIHHTKHHQAYIDKLNEALVDAPDLKDLELPQILQNLDKAPENVKAKIRNNGGGHFNHSFFWEILRPTEAKGEGGMAPSGELAEAINNSFESLDKFKEEFAAKAINHFGSGWAWLVAKEGKLEIITTPNQDNPVTQNLNPILGLDIWEHAYYLKYQNKRADYINAWWNVVDWDKVQKHYANSR
jgi:superoxide dismutase, Fe-Mn family